ncbi:MAG: tRNA dihydrouridine synthase DusB [bacterium]|nr:tRNA dihydrouridine synthase DusB [bacterium]
MSLKIGNVNIDGNIILAPMAGVTDLPFRLLCKEMGADLIYTEMVSAKGIYYNNKNTDALLEVREEERPVALQLFGSDPKLMAEMAKKIEPRNFDILDINMGCPVPKVVNNMEGSALLTNPKLLGEIVKSVSSAIEKPLTIKIRKGFGKDDCNAVEIAKIIEDNGGAAVAIHGRTREQYYSGEADWEVIARAKEAVSIPVFGNGDVTSPELAKKMLDYTKCDAVMIARGVRGNPWLFGQIKDYLATGTYQDKPSIEEVVATIKRHARLQIDCKGEYTGIREMRKHVAWYTTGYHESARLRSHVNEVESLTALDELLDEYLESIKIL